MIIVSAPDNLVDRADRALWMTPPFDIAFASPTDDSNFIIGSNGAIGAQPLGEVRFTYMISAAAVPCAYATYRSSLQSVGYRSSVRSVAYGPSVVQAYYGGEP